MWRRAFTAVLVRTQLGARHPVAVWGGVWASSGAPLPTVAVVQEPLGEGCFGRLGRLFGAVAWTWKPAEGFLSVGRGMGAVPHLASEGRWDNQDLTDPQTGLAAAAYACTPDLRREVGQP